MSDSDDDKEVLANLDLLLNLDLLSDGEVDIDFLQSMDEVDPETKATDDRGNGK